MNDIKYNFTPRDIAVYLLFDDTPYRRRKYVVEDLFKNHNSSIEYSYRTNFSNFVSAVHDLMIRMESDTETLNEVSVILSEINEHKTCKSIYQHDYFGSYFKLIKLQLMYSEISYRKIKLKNLIKNFGYKRRSAALINNINRTLNALDLIPYLKDHKTCDLHKIKLDDMIMIRLADNKHNSNDSIIHKQ